MKPFTANSPPSPYNTLGSERFSSAFYFSKSGEPVKASLIVNHTTSFESVLMRPTLSGTMYTSRQTSGNSFDITSVSKDLAIKYNCFDAGGTSIVWMQIRLEPAEALRVCGGSSGGYGPMDMYVVWSKYCRSELKSRTGIIVGTAPGLSDVVLNGKVQPAWEVAPAEPDDSFNRVVLSSVMTSPFYIATSDGSSQVYSKPRIQTEEDKVIVMLTSSYEGGVANTAPQEISVEYLCDQNAAAATEVAMTIDLCGSNVPSQNCGPEANFGYEPIELHWVKNCGLMDSSFWFSDVLVMLTLAGSILCIFGCCFNYSVKHKRGIDVVPGGKYLEKVLNKFSSKSSGWASRRSRQPDGYAKQMNIREADCNGLDIGQTQSSSGVVTVHFDGAPSAGGVAYQSSAKDDDDDFDETDF